jgi:exodeoxyribonuclease VII large subunit
VPNSTLPLDFTQRPPASPPDPSGARKPEDGTSAAPPQRGPHQDGTSAAPPQRGPHQDGTSAAPPQRGPQQAEGPRTLSVAELDRVIKRSLDVAFDATVWAFGEVTGARPATSGHLYFCLKDEREDASIDAVIYKTNVTPRMRALLVDGARVRMRGRPTFWAPRGKLQFIADRVELAGRGALLEALEKLKAKLAAEGLFAAERKRPLPAEPRIVGVVTSASGAAMHDICRVAFRRGGARLLLAPALVQGAGAGESIVRALQMLQRVRGVDVIVVGRGGGSSDDLLAFNDEAVVRAVAASKVPVVSAVGHEIDVTLTDFAADARAATPSQAAELVVPDARARRSMLAQTQARLSRSMRARLSEERERLGIALRRLGDPRLAIASFQQSLDDRVARLHAAERQVVARRRDALGEVRHRLALLHPSARIAREQAAMQRLGDQLAGAMKRRMARRERALGNLGEKLDAMSPLKVLGRGYAIATRADGRALRDASDIREGDRIVVRVHNARLGAEVVSVESVPPEKANPRGEAR